MTTKKTKVVLSLGRLHPLKGLDLLIAAFAAIKSSSKVLKCEPASLGATPSQGSAKVEEVSSAKVEAVVGEDDNTDENFRTLELSNFRTSSWQLIIAGPDEQGTKEKLEAECKKLNLKIAEASDLSDAGDADIVFMGPVQGEAKWALMKSADIFVLPSRSENFGIVVGEALSCGVPVVTTAVGPWGEGGEVLKCESSKVLKLGEENIEHSTLNIQHPTEEGGEVAVGSSSRQLKEKLPAADSQLPTATRGLIVVETSVEGIAQGLREMMALSDAERQEMGRQGSEWVKQEFSWERVAKQMVEAYGGGASCGSPVQRGHQ